MSNRRAAEYAVLAIVRDLCDRRGLRQTWEEIQVGDQIEITEKWAGLVVENITDAWTDEDALAEITRLRAENEQAAQERDIYDASLREILGEDLDDAFPEDFAAACVRHVEQLRVQLAREQLAIENLKRCIVAFHIRLGRSEEELKGRRWDWMYDPIPDIQETQE